MNMQRVLAAAVFSIVAIVAACTTTETVHVDDDDGPSTGGGGTGAGAGGSMTVPGGPEVLELTATPTSITQYEAVTFTATVTDVDGAEDLLGGFLKSPDGLINYAPFVQLSAGVFSVVLTWDQIAQQHAFDFEAEIALVFNASFTDTTQKIGSRSTTVTLSCEDSAPACAGECLPLGQDAPCTPCDESLGCDTWSPYNNSGYDALCPGAKLLADALRDCMCGPCATACGPNCPMSNAGGCDDCVIFAGQCLMQYEACYY